MLAQAPARTDALHPYRVGEIVEGKAVGIGRSALYFDLGPQGVGIIYGREFLDEKARLKNVKIGDLVAAKITELENEDGYIELSLKEAGRELTWDTLKSLKEKEELIKVKIIGANKGGLLAEIKGQQAFLPVSQLSQEHYPKVEDGDSSRILQALQKFMGEELEVEVFDLDPKEEKIILSERSKERRKIKEILAQYKAGDVVEGTITGVVDFGAFVKFGGPGDEIEGLIHISEIDWQIIENPSHFLKVGDRVKAQIIDVSNGRASLSLKTLKEDPWKEASKKYKKDDKVQGKVTKINPFGAFVEIEAKIQGLCHISEFGSRKAMEDALKAGETYPFYIIDISPEEHRMSLKLQSAGSPAAPNASAEKPEPDKTPEPETKPAE
ncbi:MAG: S1 RNA-binding domain-containing protein [Candidatus Wildermuthbacteria bacterium]|nr:S1 RNA-binding domain-containing protein [Candidatus Wildermuthbacteria bacterium]